MRGPHACHCTAGRRVQVRVALPNSGPEPLQAPESGLSCVAVPITALGLACLPRGGHFCGLWATHGHSEGHRERWGLVGGWVLSDSGH